MRETLKGIIMKGANEDLPHPEPRGKSLDAVSAMLKKRSLFKEKMGSKMPVQKQPLFPISITINLCLGGNSKESY